MKIYSFKTSHSWLYWLIIVQKKDFKVKFFALAFCCIIGLLNSVSAAITVNNHNCDIYPPDPLINAYGPFDYINPAHQKRLPIVIQYHFTRSIQRLSPDKNHSDDLRYTLKAIPNFHPALYAVSQYEQQKKLSKKTYTADCFFRRAIYFQPRDATSRMLYAMHLRANKRTKPANNQYQAALRIAPKAAELNYNYGLFLLEQGEIKKARKAAKLAYKMGYPLQGLKNKLNRLAQNNTPTKSNKVNNETP